jgi:hypothetical protein
VVYRVETDAAAQHQVDALPGYALAAYAEPRTVLEVAPWSGEPVNKANPDGPVRILLFGKDHQGMTTYLILEDQRRVDVLQVVWIDWSSPD